MAKDGIYKYWIEECSPAIKDFFCRNWETYPLTEKTECKRINNSESVSCEIAIVSSEETSTNPRKNAVFVKHNSTHVWQRRLKWSSCSCDGISFNPNLNISNLSMPGKADVKIISSNKNFRRLSDIGINIIPNDGVITKVNKKGNYYKVIGFDMCQQYVVSVSFKVAPVCDMFNTNSSAIEFPKEKFIVDEPYCLYNHGVKILNHATTKLT